MTLETRSESGFTLLETMIAVAIMLIAFSAILMTESASLNSSARAKQMNIVAMLSKNALIESEYAIQGRTFEEMDKEKTLPFPEPYNDYSYKRIIKEIKFPSLSLGGSKAGAGGIDATTEQVIKLLTNFLSKAVREVTVEVIWKKGTETQSFAVSTYWVDLNHEFQLTE